MKEERILISTIIPSYNRADTVGQTIESVLAQEMDADMEIVIGDDCSTDNAREVLLDYKEKYKMHTPRQFEMYRRIDKPYMTASLDGILTELATKRKGVWECKTHDIRNREDELEWKDHIPQKYYEQVIWYLVVMDDFDFVEVTAKLNFFDYYDQDGKKLLKTETRYYHIERADVLKHVQNLEKLVTRFWERDVVGGTIPEYKISF